MAAPGNHVLIVEHDPDLIDLLATVLRGEGYDVDSLLEGPVPEMLEQVRRRRPDLLIVDLLPTAKDHGYPLLDALRADPVTRGVPVLAMATAEPLAAAAVASYNVKATVTKPFDLDVLLNAAREALGHPPIHAELPPRPAPEGVLAQAESIIAAHSREALFRWVRRLQQEAPWKDRRDLQLPALLNQVPVLVEAVDAALHYGDPEAFFQRHPDAVERVRQHARERQPQRISLEALLREYELLREELWATLCRYLPGPLQPADILLLQRAIGGTLDRIVQITVPAYVQEPR